MEWNFVNKYVILLKKGGNQEPKNTQIKFSRGLDKKSCVAKLKVSLQKKLNQQQQKGRVIGNEIYFAMFLCNF